MVFPILGTNTELAAYEVENSLRIEDGDSPYLELAHGADGNTKTFTYSWWFKQGNITINRNFFGHSSVDDQILLKDDDRMQFSVNNSTDARFVTTQLFRDVSAWYHCVIAVDTTQSTDTNRVKIYINGTQVTAFDTANYPDQNLDFTGFNTDTNNQYVGRERGGNYFDGYMSEIYFIDGQAKAPTDFGEFNDNGVWIPKDAKDDLTFGNNGYYLEFKQTGTSQNSSGIGADTSGNDNHFAVSNLAATDVTTDTPTNNFCTYNPLATPSSLSQYGTFSEGNTTYTGHSNGSYGSSATGTFGVASGKWYWESKLTTTLSNGIGTGIRDIADWNPDWANDSTFNHTDAGGDGGYAYNYNNGKPQRDNGETTTNQGSAVSQNDIVMHAMDLDNGALYYGINGTWQASSDPESGASKTNAQHSFTVAGVYAPAAYSYSSKAFATNFGNPSFSISSGNSDANGYGNFEYAPPSGYYALCTKNLAEYG